MHTKSLNYTKVDDFIKSNLSATYSIFVKAMPDEKISQSSFDRRRKLQLTQLSTSQSSPTSPAPQSESKTMLETNATKRTVCLETLMSKIDGVTPDELTKLLGVS